uniref:Uncharacterized protein n=1 Tax=Glypta fumiferanae TaxID=389681 RepID=A0A0F6Q8C8_9HYME|nr:hypothetical protein [Glypta fumiferanae]
MNSDSEAHVDIRNELRMCKVDCRNCTFVCVHVCSTSSVRSTDIVMKQINFAFRDDFKCNECGFVLEHRQCHKFPSKKNIVIEYRCDRCRFFCNHTCFSEYNRHEVANGPNKAEKDNVWYMKVVCGNTMSRFKHTCGMGSTMWMRKGVERRERGDCREDFEEQRCNRETKRRVIDCNRRTTGVTRRHEMCNEGMKFSRNIRCRRGNCNYMESRQRIPEKRKSRYGQRQYEQRNDDDDDDESYKSKHHCCCSHSRSNRRLLTHVPRSSLAQTSRTKHNRAAFDLAHCASSCDRRESRSSD